LAKFNFTIQGSFETDDSTQALLQLSHLAEITKINMNEKFKLDFTNINVSKSIHQYQADWAWSSGPNPFHYHNEATEPIPTELGDIPSATIIADSDTFVTPPQTGTKVIPQPWKDKMKGEGMPVD
jgi:hypothetical protein